MCLCRLLQVRLPYVNATGFSVFYVGMMCGYVPSPKANTAFTQLQHIQHITNRVMACVSMYVFVLTAYRIFQKLFVTWAVPLITCC